ncbi:MAG: chorismate-binding protein, partial [Magnetococcus sp. WYHC-3]
MASPGGRGDLEGESLPEVIVDFPEFPGPLRFTAPCERLTTRDSAEVTALLARADARARAGAWVAGFVAYEAAAAFGLTVRPPWPDQPLLWLGVFDAPQPLCHSALLPVPTLPEAVMECDAVGHAAALARIKDWITAGETYQVNQTLRAILPGSPHPAQLWQALHPRHHFPYSALVRTGSLEIASFSPELFLSRLGGRLTTGPIKGTRPRHADAARDMALARELAQSPKDRAEHVMIVDMARNDLNRVCRPGSVRVGRYAAGRRFSTVHHLESLVQGEVDPELGWEALFAALFPAASITGAPKHRTMELIAANEVSPRGVYCGAMGVL